MTADLTEGSRALLISLIEDAPNWLGTPIFGYNVGIGKEAKGHLLHLKKQGYVETQLDEYGDAIVHFLPKGVAVAASLDMEVN